MTLKKWLREAGQKAVGRQREEPSVDDLINLGRLNDALTRLEERLRRRPDDTHARRKLADVLMRLGRRTEAVDEYLRVSEAFEREGFYRKANALVTKVAGLLPDDERVRAKRRRLERITRLDHLRDVVVGSLPGRFQLKVERLWAELVQGELLTRLSEEQLRRMLPTLDLRELNEEEEYVSAGVRLDELVWIVSGRMSARALLAGGKPTELRSFAAGQVIGERALFEHQPWPAIYVAAEKTTLLLMDRKALGESLIGEEDPRAFIEALRGDRNDSTVAETVQAVTRQKRAE